MTSNDLTQFVAQHVDEQESFYLNSRYTKKVQESHYNDGFAVIRMNLVLLEEWLDYHAQKAKSATDWYEAYMALPFDERRAVWEASGFHFGLYGYRKEEADAYWELNGSWFGRPADGSGC